MACPTMLIVGWADGYRNNSFRVIEQYERNGLPWRLLAGPWVHKSPERARPGPNVDDDIEVLAFFDRHLRDGDEHARPPRAGVRAPAGATRARPRVPSGPLGRRRHVAGAGTAPRAVRHRTRRRRRARRRGRRRRRGVELVRRCAAVGAAARPARRQRPLAHLRLAGRGTGGGRRHRARVAAGAVGPRLRACQRQALRRPARRLVGADHPRHARPAPSPMLAGRSTRRGRARSPSPWSQASGSTS